MAGQTYDSVPIRVERDDEQGVYKIGVVIDNAFVTIAAVKTGSVDELVERERQSAEDRAQTERDEQQQRDDEQRRQEYERQRAEAETQPQPPPPTQ